MTHSKKTLLFDANDILFSTQYIYLYNLNIVKDATLTFRSMIEKILDHTMISDKSLFQSILHRNVEYILKDDEFQSFMNFADYKDMLKDHHDSIILHTPYSKFMVNMNKINIEADVKVVYENDFEKFLLEDKLKDIPSIDVLSLEELEYFLDTSTLPVSDYGLYTTKTRLIDKYKNKGFDIMIPDTLKFLDIYDKDEHVFPMKYLWSHVV